MNHARRSDHNLYVVHIVEELISAYEKIVKSWILQAELLASRVSSKIRLAET